MESAQSHLRIRHVLFLGIISMGAQCLGQQNGQESSKGLVCLSGDVISEQEICDGIPQCKDGFDEDPTSCDCGSSVRGGARSSMSSIQGLQETEPGSHPWHVAIYNRYGHVPLCSGALIYNDIVITAASCVYDSETRRPIDHYNLVVIAGKSNKFLGTEEENSQKFEVSKIVISDRYEGEFSYYSKNLALLKLKKPAVRSFLVRTICFWEEKTLPNNISTAEVTGWGMKINNSLSFNLKEMTVNFISPTKCMRTYTDPISLRFIKYDKLCLEWDKDVVSRSKDDIGGPVSVVYEGRHYLIAIRSVNSPSNSDFGLATTVGRYSEWIRNISHELKQHGECDYSTDKIFPCKEGCISSKRVCDGTKDCPDGIDEDPVICRNSQNNITSTDTGSCVIPTGRDKYTAVKCETGDCQNKFKAPHLAVYRVTCPNGYGFSNADINVKETICVQSEWHPSIENHCLKLCGGLVSKTLNSQCFYQGQRVSCSASLRPNTIINVDCQQHYKIEPGIYFRKQTVCQSDGTFKYIVHDCIPVCGEQNTAGFIRPLLDNGKITKHGKFPWHVGLYWMTEDGKWDYKCGGSIVSSNVIITAAHCVHDGGYEVMKQPSEVSIAAGKFYSSYIHKESWEQKFISKEILVPSKYRGSSKKFAHDICAIIIDGDFQFNTYVLPTCLDLSLTIDKIPLDQLGEIAGWGIYDSSKDSSPVLREASFRFLRNLECYDKLKKSYFRDLIVDDKFCIIYNDGKGTQSGDSGGGITFKVNGLHFLQGIVSAKHSQLNEYAVVTDISYHREWITEVLNKSRQSNTPHF